MVISKNMTKERTPLSPFIHSKKESSDAFRATLLRLLPLKRFLSAIYDAGLLIPHALRPFFRKLMGIQHPLRSSSCEFFGIQQSVRSFLRKFLAIPHPLRSFFRKMMVIQHPLRSFFCGLLTIRHLLRLNDSRIIRNISIYRLLIG